jgi:tryptophanyl-tRNA synthetase
MPGVDGEKMSKSKGNGIFLKDSSKEIIKKIGGAFSGGQKTAEEQRKLGGNPEIDIACQYLSKLFLGEKESKKLFEDYRQGKLLSGEVKKMLSEKLVEFTSNFQKRLKEIKTADVETSILKNDNQNFS